jgi:hypothetical protein
VIPITSEISHHGRVPGEMSVEWYNTAIYTYLHTFIIILLLLTIFLFFIGTLKHKYELVSRVRERTVQLYSGDIRIELKGSGHGSCFRFTLPTAVNLNTGELS